jgi:Rrf2 family protein
MPIFSRKVRYALHGLGYMATVGDTQAVPFNEILKFLRSYSEELTLSPGYIAKVFQDVSRAGFTVAMTGPRGGYRLARPPEKIRLLDVIEALDGPMRSDCCLLSVGQCSRYNHCGFRGVILDTEQALTRHLQKETVATMTRKMGLQAELAKRTTARRKKKR